MRVLTPALLCAVCAAQSPSADVANAELAFAKLASEKGISAAFLANLAEGSVILGPEPVDARIHYAKDQDPGSLAWWPNAVGLSASGDLAYSTGYWEYRTARDKPILVKGHFLSMWAKQADGTWKVAFDCGVPWVTSGLFGVSDGWSSFLPAAPRPSADGLTTLRAADHGLSDGHSIMQALAFGATVYRKGETGLTSPSGVVGKLKEEPIRHFEPQGAVASKAQDLGYTWGIAKGDTGRVSYLHVWVRPSGVWQLLYDLELPLPAKP